MIRIFAAVANFNWENPNLIEGLRQCGHEVIQYDWMADGYSQYEPTGWTPADNSRKIEMNSKLLNLVKEAHRKEPIQIFFSYLSDPNTDGWVIQEIKKLGIYTINYGCDNQKKFERGHLNLAPVFDCTLYAEKNCGYKFKSIGAKALHMPYGINPAQYEVITSPKRYDASFVGQLYGYRIPFMSLIPQYGNSMVMASKLSFKDICKLTSETKVNCHFRGIGNAEFKDKNSKNIKLRDVEIPAMGGFMLAEYHPELEDYFDVGEEVSTFNSSEEFYDQVEYFAKADKDRESMREKATKRCRDNYTWVNRFNHAFKELGVI